MIVKCIFFGGGELERKWTMKDFSTSKIKKINRKRTPTRLDTMQPRDEHS